MHVHQNVGTCSQDQEVQSRSVGDVRIKDEDATIITDVLANTPKSDNGRPKIVEEAGGGTRRAQTA